MPEWSTRDRRSRLELLSGCVLAASSVPSVLSSSLWCSTSAPFVLRRARGTGCRPRRVRLAFATSAVLTVLLFSPVARATLARAALARALLLLSLARQLQEGMINSLQVVAVPADGTLDRARTRSSTARRAEQRYGALWVTSMSVDGLAHFDSADGEGRCAVRSLERARGWDEVEGTGETTCRYGAGGCGRRGRR